MKKLIAVVALIAWSGVFADYIEVKTGYGREYYEVDTPKLYVCYEKRVKYVADDGRIYLRYIGCGLYRDSCRSNGLARFGRYPNRYEAKRAFQRCLNATPRFID